MVTYKDHMDLPMSHWTDETDWPDIDILAEDGTLIIGISLEKEVKPKDEKTRKALESFRNKFVEQNCHKDEQIRYDAIICI